MLQYVIVGLIVAGAILFIIRHFAKIAGGDTDACSCCSKKCSSKEAASCAKQPKEKDLSEK
jgi:hypothetical protein